MAVDHMVRRHRPDLFDIVEAAHFRAEQVDHNVTGIKQHPVTGGQAFDAHLTETGILERAHNVIRQRADVTVRTARSDDQGVGHRALAAQIDADNVLRLIIIQLVQDDGFQRGIAEIGGTLIDVRRGGGRFRMRILRKLTRQGFAPYVDRLDVTLA